jgi:hypothetical protein
MVFFSPAVVVPAMMVPPVAIYIPRTIAAPAVPEVVAFALADKAPLTAALVTPI